MTLYTDVQIGSPIGSPFYSIGSFFKNLRVRTSVNHQSNTFEGEVYNTSGRRSDYFTLGQEVKIYHDITSPATNQIFYGRIEAIDYNGMPNKETIRIAGRDFTNYLMDAKVQAVYTSGTASVCEVGSIVRDMVYQSPFSGTIAVADVSGTSTVLQTFRVKNKSYYEAIDQLRKRVDYDFYIDFNKGLVFRPENNSPTGYQFNNANVARSSFNEDLREMYNKVTVYGDRQLITDRQSFTADGAGSVFTLIANPHDTLVTVDSTKKYGAVFEMVNFLPTGAQYLVDYDLKKIVFISGTAVGHNIPASGATVLVEYGRSNPIVKEITDESSIAQYGLRENVITNLEIKDPQQARDVARQELERTKYPALDGTVSLTSSSISGLLPGQTVEINLPFESVSGTFKVFETTYNINKENLLANSTITARVGNRIQNTSDILKNIILKAQAVEAHDTDTSDFITRARSSTGSEGLDYKWFVRTRTITGFGFLLSDATHGVLDTSTLGPNTYSAYSVLESGGNFLI